MGFELATGRVASTVMQTRIDPVTPQQALEGEPFFDAHGSPRQATCDRFERQYVLRVLDQVQWNVSRAARMLGVHRNTILAKLSAWGVQRPGGAEGRSLSL